MHPIVLSGSKRAKDNFIEEYIKERNILPYNITTFDESLKIADVRRIKKTLGLTSAKFRLIVINTPPTLESQNALLKTLEEISEDTQIIFTSEEELLPTITSRCIVKQLDYNSHMPIVDQDDISNIDNLVSAKNVVDKLLALDSFFLKERKDPVADLILLLRIKLLNAVYTKSDSMYATYLYIDKTVNETSQIKSNNLNARLLIERIYINGN